MVSYIGIVVSTVFLFGEGVAVRTWFLPFVGVVSCDTTATILCKLCAVATATAGFRPGIHYFGHKKR
jgi:hypothetical protein